MKAYPEQHIRLADGRRLSYTDVGAVDGTPVLYFHGVPSARVEWQMWEMRRCSSSSVSARQIPERLIHTALVSSLAPFDLPGMLEGVAPGNVQFLKLAVQKPWLFRLLYGQIGLLTRLAPGQFLKRALGTFDAADRAAFSHPEVHGPILAANGSGRGQQVDTALITGAWDFDPGEIAAPVQLWHGEQDHNASPGMFHYLAQTIPKAHPRLVPGEGHISLIVNHAKEILRALI